MNAIRIHRNSTPGMYYKNRPRPDFIIRTGAIQCTKWDKEYHCPLCGFWTRESRRLWRKRYCCGHCRTVINVSMGGLWWQRGNNDEIDDYVTLPSIPAGEPESVTPRHVKALLPEMKSGNVCQCCEKAFETARTHAACCSPKCRKRKSRGQCK